MQPNPYETTAPFEYTPSFAVSICSFEAVRSVTEAAFIGRGFKVVANLKMGHVVAMLRCTKEGRHLPIWYTDRIYIHELDNTMEPSTPLICDLHANDVADAETFHHPWIRLRIPNTAPYILHHRPISNPTKEFVRTTRLRKQSDRPHAIFLLNLVNGEMCFHTQTTMIQSVNLKRATRTFEWYVDILRGITTEQRVAYEALDQPF